VRKVSVLFTIAVAVIISATPAFAVQFAEPDGERHPEVGLMVAKVNGTPVWRCSGAIISERVFLTAGHCVSGATSVEVWFTPERPAAYPFTGDYSGTPIPHPKYDDFAEYPATYDIGVVLLDSDHPGPYASLASQGTVDTMATGSRQGPQFDLVGYGMQDALPPDLTADVTRYFGQASLVNTQSANNAGYSVQLTASPGTGGALCFGDSGGPVFLTGTTTVVAVNSFVFNSQCMGSGFSYRTDTADSLNFVNQYLP
jgi:secreted trypsin-like serine protease